MMSWVSRICAAAVSLILVCPGYAQSRDRGSEQLIELRGDAGGKRFDGVGVVEGGGATGVLLKDYPEPQRSEILDLLFKPKFGASISALYVEIPGDGNSTQGSMPSHMHTRDDLNYSRGYIWWELVEAKKRNRDLLLDGTGWSAPGWIGDNGKTFPQNTGKLTIDTPFYSEDVADYYIKWLQGLRDVYGLQMNAVGSRNEKGVSYAFVERFRQLLDLNGFSRVKLHCCDNWPDSWKLAFVNDMLTDKKLRDSIDVISTHNSESAVPSTVQRAAEDMHKPLWDTEEHVYKAGFAGLIGTVRSMNRQYIENGFTKITDWYGIGGVYTIEPYSGEKEATLRANWPWSGHFEVNQKLWGFAHYGQFSDAGWRYLKGGSGNLNAGGSFVTLMSPDHDYSLIIETSGAASPQTLHLQLRNGLSDRPLAVWRSNKEEQFVRIADVAPTDGVATFTVDPESVYSLTTTRGQQKGNFQPTENTPFPFPYRETFDEYSNPAAWGYLPRYFADISGAFELAPCPKREGQCLHQVTPIRAISWAPDWLPYTIVGDSQWRDYEVSIDVRLGKDETAALMGRINNVGSGYGFIPKGYYLELSDSGRLRLVVVRGKVDKKKPVGDAEQQALIAANKDFSEGGEKTLTETHISGILAGQWHSLKLRFEANTIKGFVDGREELSARDSLYGNGMVGLLAGAEGRRLSMPYFDDLIVKRAGEADPDPTTLIPASQPLYPGGTGGR